MKFALIGISVLVIVLVIYLIGMKLQLRSITRQLNQRRIEQSMKLIVLEMNDKDLKKMVVALNKTLRQETELRISQEKQEQELKNLITNISHDLRTPLTVMKGYLQLLEQCKLDGRSREYLEICFRHSGELERRIRQFFEYSYWAAQEDCIQLHIVNITNIVTDVLTDFIPFFEEKGISMRLEDEAIYKGWGEEDLLKRTMQNILKNCLQYATGEVSVSIEEWKEDKSEGQSKLRICVKNPIAEDCEVDVDKVFLRFYVGHAERNQSTGLGLSIVKLLVEKMQGTVFARKEGNVFYVGFFISAKE